MPAQKDEKGIVINCDGLCQPTNPGGTATWGFVIHHAQRKLHEDCGVIGSGRGMTNNVAEYTALIKACEWLLQNEIRARTTIVRSDSQLLIRQLSKRYAVRSPRLLPLYNQVTALLRELRKQCEQVYFEWVPREKNKEADALSVKAYVQHQACRN